MKGGPKYIFIGGSGRSGTTLVQKILLGHPRIGGGPELYFTQPIFELLERMLLMHETNCFHPSLGKQKIEELVKSLYDGLLQAHDDGQIIYISEKTPTNIHVAGILLNTYKNAVFLNIYRDGRAVLNSHFNVRKRAKTQGKNLTEIGLVKTAVYWNRCIMEGLDVQKQFHDRLINISYEKLISKPDQILKEVFEKLGLDTYPEMLKPEKINLKEGESKPHINNIWYTEEMYVKSFDESKLDAWKSEMNLFQRFWAASMMYNGLKILGYEVNSLHKYGNRVFFFFYHIKNHIRANRLFYPFLYVKRKLY